MTEDGKARDADLEWESRILCSDESCIGVIGPDGRCTECGRPYDGMLPDRITPNPSHEASADSDGEADASGESSDGSPPTDNFIEDDSISVSDDEWERRTLCPDESCIGVIGPDGRCKECGRSLSGEA